MSGKGKNIPNTEKMLKRGTELISRPIVIVIIFIVLIINIYLGGGGIISNIMIVLLALYIIFLFFEYFLKINITTNISDLFSNDPKLNIKMEKINDLDKDKNKTIYGNWSDREFNYISYRLSGN